jgi:hypothetical protein
MIKCHRPEPSDKPSVVATRWLCPKTISVPRLEPCHSPSSRSAVNNNWTPREPAMPLHTRLWDARRHCLTTTRPPKCDATNKRAWRWEPAPQLLLLLLRSLRNLIELGSMNFPHNLRGSASSSASGGVAVTAPPGTTCISDKKAVIVGKSSVSHHTRRCW